MNSVELVKPTSLHTQSFQEKSSLYARMQEVARETIEKSLVRALEPEQYMAKASVKISSLWKDSAVLLPETNTLFARCGLDPTRVNPVSLGEGLNHVVFEYLPKDGMKKVIKIPRESTIGMMNSGRNDERENIALAMKYFPNFAVPTEVRTDIDSGKYIVVQDAVEGPPVTNMSQTKEITVQLQEIMKANRLLMKETGHSMDFVGLPGFVGWAKKQFRKFFLHTSVFEISNLLIDDTNRIKIIDYDMLRLQTVPFTKRVVSNLGFRVNYYLLKWYFGVDMKKQM